MPEIQKIDDAYIDAVIKATEVYDPNLEVTQGIRLRELIKMMRDQMEQQGDLSQYQTKLSFDDQPVAGSNNPVKSSGIYSYIQHVISTLNINVAEQKLTYFNATMVGSGGIYFGLLGSGVFNKVYLNSGTTFGGAASSPSPDGYGVKITKTAYYKITSRLRISDNVSPGVGYSIVASVDPNASGLDAAWTETLKVRNNVGCTQVRLFYQNDVVYLWYYLDSNLSGSLVYASMLIEEI